MTNPEPLKGNDGYKNSHIIYNDIRVRSAVEWLKDSLSNLDVGGIRHKQYIGDMINKAFEDVMVKQNRGGKE